MEGLFSEEEASWPVVICWRRTASVFGRDEFSSTQVTNESWPGKAAQKKMEALFTRSVVPVEGMRTSFCSASGKWPELSKAVSRTRFGFFLCSFFFIIYSCFYWRPGPFCTIARWVHCHFAPSTCSLFHLVHQKNRPYGLWEIVPSENHPASSERHIQPEAVLDFCFERIWTDSFQDWSNHCISFLRKFMCKVCPGWSEKNLRNCDFLLLFLLQKTTWHPSCNLFSKHPSLRYFFPMPWSIYVTLMLFQLVINPSPKNVFLETPCFWRLCNPDVT